jgi:hypothetical protein
MLFLGTRWGEWSASRPGRAFIPRGKDPPVPIVQEAGWAPELVWTQRLEEIFPCLCRGSNLDRPAVQSVFRHYTDLTSPAPIIAVNPTEKMEDVALNSKNFSSLSVVGSHCISRADNVAVLGFVDDMNTK